MMTTRLNKTILLLATVGMLGAGSAFAGNGPGDCDQSGTCEGNDGNRGAGKSQQMQQRGGPANHMARMAQRFGLSEEQQIEALKLFGLHEQDRADVRARMLEDYGPEICAQRDQHREEFRALLNDEQKAMHDEMAQRRGNREGRNGGGFGGFDCPSDTDTETATEG